jgi:hypothetical protein
MPHSVLIYKLWKSSHGRKAIGVPASGGGGGQVHETSGEAVLRAHNNCLYLNVIISLHIPVDQENKAFEIQNFWGDQISHENKVK